MKSLCLDLATTTGFAIGDDAGVQAHGAVRLPSTGYDIGAFLHAYRSWLVPRAEEWRPDEIVFEMPILPAKTNPATVRKLTSLCGLTELLARDAGIQCREANLWNIRNHFIGTRFAPKIVPKPQRSRWLKDAIKAECRRRGFRPTDDNAADALALFSYVTTSRHPGFVMAGDELERAA